MSGEITRSIIIRRRASELFRIWEDIENLPRLLKNVVAVQNTGKGTSRWTVRGPFGIEVQWDVEKTMAEPPKRIGWNTRMNGALATSGEITFNQLQNEQTEVAITMKVVPVGGAVGQAILALLANPESMLDEDLRAFKTNVERLRTDPQDERATDRS